MNEKDSVSIILPTYNEKENIINLINECIKYAKNLKEIIVVDDNSPDKTWELVQNFKNEKVRVIRRMDEKGLPSAIWRGIEESKGEIVIWMDCDLSHHPKYIPALLGQLENCDIAVASRYAEGGKDLRPFSRIITSYMMNAFISLVFLSRIRDWDSGYLAARKYVFEKVQFSKKGYGEYFIELMYKAVKENFKVCDVGYIFTDRQEGSSKTSQNIFSMPRHALMYSLKALRLRFSKWKK